jgi:hypothetical protein
MSVRTIHPFAHSNAGLKTTTREYIPLSLSNKAICCFLISGRTEMRCRLGI